MSTPGEDTSSNHTERDSTWALSRRLWRTWLAPRGAALSLSIALMTIVAALTSSYALIVTRTFEALESGTAQTLWLAPGLILAVTGANAIVWFAQMIVTQKLVLRVIQDMQRAMYARLLSADFARISVEPAGSLTARFINDVDRVREGLMRAVTNLIRDALTVVASVAVMIYIDWVLALLVLGAYPLAFQPVIALGQRLRRASTAAQEQVGELTAFLTESFSGDRLVKTYRLEQRQTERGDDQFERRFALNMKMARGRAGVEPILEFAGGLALAGILAVAAWRSSQSDAAIPELLGFLTAVAVLAPRARAIGTLNAVAQEALAAVARIFDLLDEEPAVLNAEGAAPLQVSAGAVALEGVNFTYPDGAQALHDLTLLAEPGKTTALVGPSGGGKSTVLNLIPRLYDTTSGAVRIDGTDVRDASLASLRDAIAVVSQDATLFDDTVRANVAFGQADASDADIWSALEAAAAKDFVEALPKQLDAPVGPGGGRLSGGQRQRLALARAVLKDAPILLLDEATSALDAESEAKVQAALERVSQGRTTIVIAHRLSTVMRADKIYVLDGGRVVEEGTDETLKSKRDGVYAHLRALQFSES